MPALPYPARKVPSLTTTPAAPPLRVVLAGMSKVPGPVLIRLPPELVIAVRLFRVRTPVALATLTVPFDAPMAIVRLKSTGPDAVWLIPPPLRLTEVEFPSGPPVPGELGTTTKPPLTVSGPTKLLAPLSVCVPLPIFVTDSVPSVLLIAPLWLPFALLSPRVRVTVPLVLATLPLPFKPLIVSFPPARLSSPIPVPLLLT